MSAPPISAIRAVGRTVADLARTEAFYRDGLGFASLGAPEPLPEALAAVLGLADRRATRLRMRLGAQELDFLAVDPPGAPYPEGALANDPVFQHIAVPVRDMDAAARRLAARGPAPIGRGGPQRLPPASGGVTAWKLRDPDGHPLELIHFPDGAPAAAWADAPGLFLGIDHSALTVTDLDAALAFFTGPLGFRITQRGLNRGPEQGRLDGLPEPVVDVVSLEPRPGARPHLELLHYRQPATRRQTPSPFGPADRATSRLVLGVTDPASVANAVRAAGFPVRSATGLAFVAGPDGHGLVLVAET